MNNDNLRFPIGKFSPQEKYSTQELKNFIQRIENLPDRVANEVKSFTKNDFEKTYREDGWTGRQVIHHLADSHMNSYIRFKWTLTEDMPTIKAYDENAWAKTGENLADPVISIALLKALHLKWTTLLQQLTAEELKKQYIHPESKKHISLEQMLALYAWHGDHHLGHLKIIAAK